jgi:hypothetical protein
VNAFEAYKLYLALKQHFTVASYNFFKYNGKVRASTGAFEKRKDRYFFEKLSRIPDPQTLIVANLLEDVTYVNDMLSPEGRGRGTKYQARLNSLSNLFREDMTKALETNTFDQLLNFSKDSQYPPLLAGYLSKQISIQTVIILDCLCHFIDNWDRKLTDDYLWPDIRNKLVKYRPFLVFDKAKFKKISVDLVLNKADI